MFFVTKEKMPEGVGFQAYGLPHILWLAAGLVLCVAACVFYRKLSENKRKGMLTVLGAAILLLEVAKDAVLLCIGEMTWEHLPLHLCGINILLIAFDVVKQTKTVRSFLYFFAIPGAALALLFPNWTTLPLWNFFNLHSFVIHILLVMYPLLLVTTDQVAAGWKDIAKSVALLVAMAIPVYFVNLLCGTNFMFLMEPESGNPLEMFEKLLGSHLWGFPILLPVVILVMCLPLLIIRKRRLRTMSR